MRKPWWNTRKGAWYVWHEGKQTRLAVERDEADLEWHRLAAHKPAPIQNHPDPLIAVLVDKWLAHAKRHVRQETWENYQRYALAFCAYAGGLNVSELGARHVEQWIETQPQWGQASRRAAITVAKMALQWAADEGLIGRNPLRKLRRPASTRRGVLIGDVDHRRMLAATDRHFRKVLIALRHSGCRPGEIAAVTPWHYDAENGLWRFERHKSSDKTSRPRIVPLTGCLDTLTRILTHYAPKDRPPGPLFLNRVKQPWTRNAIRLRMRGLRRKLGLPEGTVAYSYRHAFVTDGLANGVDALTMATIVGHTSTDMILRHYSHLAQRAGYLRAQAARATGAGKGATQS